MSEPLKPGTLVLIHGATLNRRMWDTLRRHLDARYHVIAPDLPGHGSRRTEPFSLAGAVKTVEAAVESAPPGPVIVGGDSLGGYTTLASAASLLPDRVRAFLLCGCTTVLKGRALLPYYKQIALFNVLTGVLGEQRLIASVAAKMVSEMHLPPADVESIVEAGISLGVFKQAVKALRGIEFRDALARVVQPVLIVNGTRDFGHMHYEPGFAAVARDALVKHVEGSEHGVTIRRPVEVAALFNEFANRILGAAPAS